MIVHVKKILWQRTPATVWIIAQIADVRLWGCRF
jgi:hypothetical protein